MAASTAALTARRGAPLILAAWLAACAGDPQAIFDLTPAAPRSQSNLRAQIHVLEPVAAADLDSDRVLVRTGPAALAVMAGARWAGPLPALLQARLTELLQNAQGPRKADDAGTPGYDYNLETDVRAFEFDAEQRQVAVEIAVKLVSARDGHIVSVRTFKALTPVASTDPHVVTAALNGALSRLLVQIVGFVAASA